MKDELTIQVTYEPPELTELGGADELTLGTPLHPTPDLCGCSQECFFLT